MKVSDETFVVVTSINGKRVAVKYGEITHVSEIALPTNSEKGCAIYLSTLKEPIFIKEDFDQFIKFLYG